MEPSFNPASPLAPKPGVLGSEPEQVDDKLIKLIEVLLGIDANSPLAKLNETTISDNNGGRIVL